MPIKFDKDGNLKSMNSSTTCKYNPAYPEMFLEHCKKGKTVVQFCRDISVGRDTFDSWCKTYPEMGEAKILGKQYAEAYWLDLADCHQEQESESVQLNMTLYRWTMGGRFGHGPIKKPKIKTSAADILGSFAEIAKAFQEGKISVQEFAILSDALVKVTGLVQHEKMSKDLEELKAFAEKTKAERVGESEETV